MLTEVGGACGLTLVIATGHALSLALFDGPRLLAADDRPMATGQAEALMPAVAALLEGRVPVRIVVETGPGSFTGLRIGLAAATGLGLAWGVPVRGVGSGALVAAPLAGRAGRMWVALAAPRGQLWLEEVDAASGATLTPPRSLRETAGALPAGAVVAGTGAGTLQAARVLADAPARAAGWNPRLADGPPTLRYVRPYDHVGA